MSGVAMATSKSNLPGLDLRRQIVGADDVGAGLAGLGSCLARREHGYPHVLASAGGQTDGAAHHLVGLAGIDAEAHGDVDTLVEAGLGQVLDDADRLRRCIELVAIERLQRVGELLAGHCCSFLIRLMPPGRGPPGPGRWCQTTSMPIERAVPRTCCLAASRS